MGRGTTNLLLVGALLALGALAWFKPGAGDKPVGELAFPGADATKLLRATNTFAANSWTLERGAGDAWALTAPFRLPADPAVVAALLADLASARAAARYPASALKPAVVGLDAPSLLLELAAAMDPQGAGAARYAFGGTEPIDNRRYVQHGDEVLLLDELLYYRLSQGWSNLADKRVLPRDARITRLELPGIVVSVDAAGKRTLVPDDPSISADALTQLLDAWTRQSAMELKPLDPELVAQATLRVTLAGLEPPLEFKVLQSTEGLRLGRADLGIEYSLPSESRRELLTLPRLAAPLASPAPATH